MLLIEDRLQSSLCLAFGFELAIQLGGAQLQEDTAIDRPGFDTKL
jgi:hypothetical protein